MCTSNFTFSSKQRSRVNALHSNNWLENKKKKTLPAVVGTTLNILM